MDIIKTLIKEALIVLFRSFPGQFVLVGGGALHWIFNSPRWSLDIDLKPLHPPATNLLPQIARELEKKLLPMALSAGVTVTCRVDSQAQAVGVQVDGRPAFQIELAALAPVSGKEKHLLQSDSLQSEIIVTPGLDQLLLAKAAALAKRPQLKGRDVFDIWFLQSRGAKLDTHEFETWLKWEELDATDLQKKLDQITPSRLRADLGRFLPESIHDSLAEENYQTLILAARRLLEPFL